MSPRKGDALWLCVLNAVMIVSLARNQLRAAEAFFLVGEHTF